MGVDALGKYCILGTRRHLIIVDLDQPEEVKRRISRQSNWDVTQVQWNPCIAKKEYFATTVSLRVVCFAVVGLGRNFFFSFAEYVPCLIFVDPDYQAHA